MKAVWGVFWNVKKVINFQKFGSIAICHSKMNSYRRAGYTHEKAIEVLLTI